ncbi:MAG: hypothetical protein KAS32_10515 [Candidatus Peribacteraceae bacterium]|nr:hypothetical protein [Candidatus Peribacteraceae bacterium]
MRKKSSTYWKKKCDALWSDIVRQVGKCEICHKPGLPRKDGLRVKGLEAHHLISKGANLKFRHDLSNGICLCFQHHKGNNNIAAHGANDVTTRFMEWLEAERPGQWKWFCENRDNKCFEKMDYESIYYELKEIFEKGKT